MPPALPPMPPTLPLMPPALPPMPPAQPSSAAMYIAPETHLPDETEDVYAEVLTLEENFGESNTRIEEGGTKAKGRRGLQ